MIDIRVYKNPGQFLEQTEKLLEENEVDNNLILGLCNHFADKNAEQPNHVFVAAIEEGKLIACSLKTPQSVIISSFAESNEGIVSIAHFYRESKIPVTNLMGLTPSVEKFVEHFSAQISSVRKLLSHKATDVHLAESVPGNFEKASLNDLGVLTQFAIDFQKEANPQKALNIEIIQTLMRQRIEAGLFYKWMDGKHELVSVAGIVRKTKNTSVIGLVYTPPAKRGSGYASACVYRLTKEIINSGDKSAVLFTDMSNPASNHMYHKMGYKPCSEHSDVSLVFSQED